MIARTRRTRRPKRNFLSSASPLIVSALFHMAILLILALWFVPVIVGSDLLLTGVYHNRGDESLQELDEPNLLSQDDTVIDQRVALAIEQVRAEFELPVIASPIAVDDPPTPAGVGVPVATTEASSVEGAVDGITGSIKAQLKQGDLLVIWLFDSSQSLVDDRKRVAERLEPFFEEVRRGQGAEGHRLSNAVVSFGTSMKQRVPPTKFSDQIVKAVEKLPIDSSGKENVFAAVARCAKNYRANWSGQLMVVVWTDETGDDTDRIEETIAICRQNRVAVSVVGPSAVLGADTGLHSYTDPKTDVTYQLPVQRGPDSALRERVELGYWFWARPPGFEGRGNSADRRPRGGFPRGFSYPSWYGGRNLVGIVSGFSPYALTRLAAQTEGSYTIFERPEDRGPFRWDAMQAYAPDYRATQKYLAEAQASPIRRAILSAVEVTVDQKLVAPENQFFVVRDKHQPSAYYRPYLTPAQFASRMKTARRSWLRKASRMARLVEEALVHVSEDGAPERAMRRDYALENTPRWRAWYQLTRGRLLAASVRLEEYRLALEQIGERGFLAETTNHLMLRPSVELVSGPIFQARAQEAGEWLDACVDEHRGTPWAYLAQRELVHGAGIDIRQRSLKPTGVVPETWQPRLPKL